MNYAGADMQMAEMRDRYAAACAERDALAAELETERMRLAACGTAALGYFNGCADEYRSGSLEDTLRLRARVDKLEAALTGLRSCESQGCKMCFACLLDIERNLSAVEAPADEIRENFREYRDMKWGLECAQRFVRIWESGEISAEGVMPQIKLDIDRALASHAADGDVK